MKARACGRACERDRIVHESDLPLLPVRLGASRCRSAHLSGGHLQNAKRHLTHCQVPSSRLSAVRRSQFRWGERRDSNPRPPEPQSGAPPAELRSPPARRRTGPDDPGILSHIPACASGIEGGDVRRACTESKTHGGSTGTESPRIPRPRSRTRRPGAGRLHAKVTPATARPPKLRRSARAA